MKEFHKEVAQATKKESKSLVILAIASGIAFLIALFIGSYLGILKMKDLGIISCYAGAALILLAVMVSKVKKWSKSQLMKDYKQQVKLSKENIEKTQKMLEEIEKWEQRKFEKKVLENTDNFWTCE